MLVPGLTGRYEAVAAQPDQEVVPPPGHHRLAGTM
jgi:hypothetical protein